MKYLFIGTLIPCLLIFLISCGTRTEPVERVEKQVKPIPHVTNTLSFKRFALSESEHIFIIDVDDKYVPRRCMIFVNDLSKTTSPISCNFDDAGSPLPEQGTE